MATYISLIRFTEQGARNIKKSVDRAHAFDQAADPVNGQSIVASNTALHPAMVKILQSAFSALPS